MIRPRVPLARTVAALIGALFLVAILALAFVRVDRVVVARGRLCGGSHPVRSAVAGRIRAISVHSGDQVEVGRQLLELDLGDLEGEREAGAARLAALETQAAELRADREHRVRVEHVKARTDAALARDSASLAELAAQKRVDAFDRLSVQGLVEALSADEARIELDRAKVAVKSTQVELDSLDERQAGELRAIDSQIAELASRVAEERARESELERKSKSATIRAEFAGTLRFDDPRELLGRAVAVGDELLRIVESPADRFEGVIGDLGRPKLVRGQSVRLRVDGYPWLIYGSVEGELESASERGLADGGFPVLVRVHGDTTRIPLFDGMRAAARIQIGERVALGRLMFEDFLGPSSP